MAKNRDPLKKGPNDMLTSASPLVPSASTDDNLTFNLAKSLLESGVLGAISEDGRITSTDFLDKLELPKNLNPEVLLRSAAVVTEKDLTPSAANDPPAIKNYFNRLSAVYAKHFAPLPKRGDLVILSEALQNRDYARLAELDLIILALDSTAGDMKKIPVPTAYRSFAVREINNLLQTKRTVEIFRNTQSDPLATAVVLQQRLELFEELRRARQEIRTNLEAKGIVFEPNEDGYAYFQ